MRDMIFRPGTMKPGIDQRRLSKGGKKGEQNNMKRKFVLRLLAAVMAVSLTATSVPSSLLSTVETVYAASATDTATMTSADFTITDSTITINAGKTDASLYYGLVPSGVGKTSSDCGETLVQGDSSAVALNGTLEANTKYDIYSYNANTVASSTADTYLCTVTTAKISLTDAEVKICIDGGNDAAGDDLSSKKLTYNGQAQEGKVVKITPKGKNAITDASTIASNFDIVWSNNTNAADKDAKVAPTVTVTAKANSKYTGSAKVTFTIEPLTLTSANTRITINGSVYTTGATVRLPYDGLAQDPTIKVEAKLADGYKELVRKTDYDISYDGSSGTSNTNTTDSSGKGLNATTDAGTVTLVFSTVTGGNYTVDSSVTAGYIITKSTPATPSAPVIKDVTDTSFVIDTSDEDLRYTYQYLILTEDEVNNKTYSWPASGDKLTSAAVAGTGTAKKNITVATSSSETKATPAGGTAGNALKKQDGSTSLLLEANKTYYVVRQIVGDDNVTGTTVSAAYKVTMAKTSIASVVKSAIVGTNKIAAGADLTSNLKLTYTGKDTGKYDITLYDQAAQAGNVLSGGYEIKYYNDQNNTSTYWNAANEPQGVEDDTTNAGTVYIWAVADGSVYSGYVLVGKYTIAKADLTLTVGNQTMDYDGLGTVDGLTASATFNGQTVSITNMQGTLVEKSVGKRAINAVKPTNDSVYTNTGNFNISYDFGSTEITINQATVVLTAPSSITVAYGQTISLGAKTNVKEVTDALTYTLNNDSTSAVASALDLTTPGSITCTDYASIKDVTNIKVSVRLGSSTDDLAGNYKFADKDGKEISITVVPATATVKFPNDDGVKACQKNDGHTDKYQHATGTITVKSYTRRAAIAALVEEAGSTALGGANTDLAGIPVNGNVNSLGNYYTLNSKYSTAYVISADGSDLAQITYKYYKADGVTELYDIPTADGTYVVKAYLKAATGKESQVHGQDGSDSSDYAGSIKLIIGGGSSSSGTTTSGDGSYEKEGKFYDKNDILITDQFVTIDGNTYYADSTGSKVIGKVKFTAADGEDYIAAEDGTIYKDTKTTVDGKDYVVDANGVVLKSQIAITPSGNKVYVDKTGAIVKNKVVTYKKKKYYATRTGRIAINTFVTTKLGNKVYATKDGSLKVNVVFTVGKYKYYAGSNAAIATSGLTKTKSGNTVFATKSGKLKVNTTFKYKGTTYKANKKGVVKKVK
jgi:hypothetical protein